MNRTPILVLGIGNLLIGDEGVGVHAVRRLMEESPLPGVDVVDGGTGGFHLLGYFSAYPTVILIDAAHDGKAPGNVAVSEPRYPSEFPRSLTAHDIGLRDMIESAALLGPLPKMFLITVSVGGDLAMGTHLSPEVERSIPAVLRCVRDLA